MGMIQHDMEVGSKGPFLLNWINLNASMVK